MNRKAAFRGVPVIAALLLALLVMVPGASAQDPAGLDSFPEPIDPQSWELPDDMTWDDYEPLPGFDWNHPERQPAKKLRAALILADYPNLEFVASQPIGSDLAGNPIGVGGVPRDEVADWYTKFLITEPNELNHGHTVNEYWLENSYGALGVDADGFGPYRMDFDDYAYGLGDTGGGLNACPTGKSCGKNFDNELLQKSAADVTAGTAANGGKDYDFRFLLHAGYDESGTWQEFGEMRFQDRDSVTDDFGNPDETKPNWAQTRYIPWTSFWASKGIWSHATPGVMSTQGENDGAATYAHELSHILGILDNYNNPYGNPVTRAYSGPWGMMSRGSFNGPGGPHNRWQIPPTQGMTMGAHHLLRDKIRLGFMKPNEVMFLDRNELSKRGPVFADVWARAIPLGPTAGRMGLHGLMITLTDGDKSPSCTLQQDWRCDRGGYNHYTVEVVDRIGYDSFTPDNGVIISKTKNSDASAPFIWVIDSHPADINEVDFIRPDGTPAMMSVGDYRQLSDATFHAGNGPGVVSEYVDAANRLHFYILGKERDAEGVLSYRVAVRATDGAVPLAGDMALTRVNEVRAAAGRVARYDFRLTNSLSRADIVRLTATTDQGWETFIPNDFIEVAPGATNTIPVYVHIPVGTSGTTAVLRLKAASDTSHQKRTLAIPVSPV